MKRKTKQVLMLTISIMIFIVLLSNVSAYTRICMKKGQVIPSKQRPMYTCKHDMCMVCVNDKNYPSNPNYCNDKSGCTILGIGEEEVIDTQAPSLIINSPINNKVYNNKKVLFDLKADELSKFYYLDNSNGKSQWKSITNKYTQSFQNSINLKEGLNEISIKAVDKKGNENLSIKKFYVDSQAPKIKSVSPTKGFTDGNLIIQFTEQNPKSLKMYYGNSIKAQKSIDVNMNNCSNGKGLTTCNIIVNLQDYNNQQISYYFLLEDIAGSKIQSKTINLGVDNLSPLINNPNSMFSIQKKSVLFDIGITESNFQDVSIYDNSIRNPKWTKICTSLKNGKCTKKLTFTSGNHQVDVKVTDKAGNSVTKSVNISI